MPGGHRCCSLNTYFCPSFPVSMKARELAAVVHKMFFLETQTGVCTPGAAPSRAVPVPSLTASLCFVPRSRRAPLPSRGSRVSSPHLPSKVLRALPCPWRAPVAGGQRPQGTRAAGGSFVPSHQCLHTLPALPAMDHLPDAGHLSVLSTQPCCSGKFICLKGNKKFVCFD